MRLAVYPGTFDPITNGHLDVVAKVAPLFDSCVIAVLHNPNKQPLFTVEERLDLIQAAVACWANVRVESFSGLLADYTKQIEADVVVRGLRSVSDFEAELPMAQMNQRLDTHAVTVFIPTSRDSADISSSLVRQVAMHGGDVAALVPLAVCNALRSKFMST